MHERALVVFATFLLLEKETNRLIDNRFAIGALGVASLLVIGWSTSATSTSSPPSPATVAAVGTFLPCLSYHPSHRERHSDWPGSCQTPLWSAATRQRPGRHDCVFPVSWSGTCRRHPSRIGTNDRRVPQAVDSNVPCRL